MSGTARSWQSALEYLLERASRVKVHQPDSGRAVRRLEAFDRRDRPLARWLVADDGTIRGAWDPEYWLDDYEGFQGDPRAVDTLVRGRVRPG